MSTFAEAFPIAWGPLDGIAGDAGVIGLGLIPPVTCLIVRPFPSPPESRIIAPADFDPIYAALESYDRSTVLPPGVSRRVVPIEGLLLRMIVLRRPLETGLALDQMVKRDFLTPHAAEILRSAIAADENIVIGGPNGSARTSLLYACLGEVPPDRRILIAADSEPRIHAWLSLPGNAERVDPFERLGLAHLIRAEMRSPERASLMVLDEVRNWAVSLAITAAIEEKWTLWATVHARDAENVVIHLTTMTAADKLRAEQKRIDVQADVLGAFGLIVAMEKQDGVAFVSRIARPISSSQIKVFYRSPRPGGHDPMAPTERD